MSVVALIFDLHAMRTVRKPRERNRIPPLRVQRSARRERRQTARVRQIRRDGNLHAAGRHTLARACDFSADAGRHSVNVAAFRRFFHRRGQLLLRPCRRRQQRDQDQNHRQPTKPSPSVSSHFSFSSPVKWVVRFLNRNHCTVSATAAPKPTTPAST